MGSSCDAFEGASLDATSSGYFWAPSPSPLEVLPRPIPRPKAGAQKRFIQPMNRNKYYRGEYPIAGRCYKPVGAWVAEHGLWTHQVEVTAQISNKAKSKTQED